MRSLSDEATTPAPGGALAPSALIVPKRAINWNALEDELDKMVWEKLITQFWVATRFPISNDLTSWRKLTPAEQELVLHVFAGLTLLDTIQGSVGAPALLADAATPHEEAVLANIAFMEHVHAQSYSQIFQTLASTTEINAAFRWAAENERLQFKARTIQGLYADPDPLRRKVASVMLESFLFYSGFFLPLWLNGHARLPNTADIIKFIIRDEAIHGYYIGHKFQRGLERERKRTQGEIKDFAYDLLGELYDNEVRYTQDLYDAFGLTEDVKVFLRYNANKALMNLGLEPLFPSEPVNPIVLSGLSLGAETHDFFSTTGSYVVGRSEPTTDEDWDF
ncbi:class 1b ribonucleoside-diphosphate reductase subunit beta [Miltoncostaea oceani]|uniref:class 1b ribonucleoside-diphosphate reductase subunit beta n=1 Tax=Miltoncostaea oceani TaxID=2843216 RepID=UPI001C3DE98C|nr:class 1b ribonucleoside-diphosphate reductase subunit beta [Miltoncostaea oceani]